MALQNESHSAFLNMNAATHALLESLVQETPAADRVVLVPTDVTTTTTLHDDVVTSRRPQRIPRRRPTTCSFGPGIASVLLRR